MSELIQEVLRAARLLFQPGDTVEVRVLNARGKRTISGYFNDFQLLAAEVEKLNRERYPGVYWTINPVDSALLSRASNRVQPYAKDTTLDENVLRRHWLPIDLDPDRPTGISSTNAQHDASLAHAETVRAALMADGWPEPIFADSGNGAHLDYSIDLPNDDESRDLLKRVLEGLAARFNATIGDALVKVDRSVFNAARIIKIYGTVARKGDDTPERPHRVSRILQVPALLAPVSLDLLRAQAVAPPAKPAARPSAYRGAARGGADFSLREFLDRHGIRYRNPVADGGGLKFVLEACPFNPEHKAPDSAVWEYPDGYGFKCFHDSCHDNDWKAFRAFFEPDAYSRRPADRPFKAPASKPSDDDIPPYSPPLDEAPGYDEGESVSDQETLAIIFDAIERGDQDGVNLLTPEIAKLKATDTLRIKTKMAEKFGRKFRAKDFEAAIRDERRRGIAGLQPENTGLPIIVVNNRPMRDVVDDSLAALRAANDPPFLFVRSGEMIFVEMDERQRPSIKAVEKAHLRGRLDRAANYIRRGSESDIAVPPPVEIVEDILALPSALWGVPPLEFVVEVPTLRPDGTVLSSPGYDPISRMLYAPAPGFKMEPIPDVIDGAELEAAVCLVDEAIYDFPFAEERDDKGNIYPANPSRANFFGLLLTPIVRPAISGVVPMALIDAPQAGTGKSLLADLFSVITTGRTAAMMPFPRNEEEMQKSIGSTLLAGAALVCFDNIEGNLNSPTLALVLTAREYQARILGVSENMLAPNRAAWLGTGNNIKPVGDMLRRCYTVRLDAKRSRPYQGREFKHENLLEWARAQRAHLLRALLIIARAWYQRKNKPVISNAWGSFEEWHRTVGGILRSASVDGFLSNLQKFLEEGDDSVLQWESFLAEIEAALGPAWFRVGQITREVRESSTMAPSRFTIPDSLADVDRKKEGGFERALGKSFGKRLGTRFGERELHLRKRIDSHTKQAEWRVLTRETEAMPDVVATPDAPQETTY